MQNAFGSGILWATATQDAYGNAIANPTPQQLGVLQDFSLDKSWDTKLLYGQNQEPVAAGRGKGKGTIKAKLAQIHGLIFSQLVFGQAYTNQTLSDVYDTTGAAIPATPFQITPTVPSAGTWTQDLGVRNANGVPLIRVASAPATGQYAVSAGVYTFAAADVGTTVYINFQYTATSTLAKRGSYISLPMGYAPLFRLDIYMPYAGKALVLTAPSAICEKFALASKQDDFLIPELDILCIADSSGNGLYWGTSE